MIRSRTGQRLVGLLLIVVGGWFTASEWQTFRREGYYHPKAAALFPAFAVLGLGMLLFPIDYDRLRAEEGVDRLDHFGQYPPVWKVWIFVALAAGLGNWYAIAHSPYRPPPPDDGGPGVEFRDPATEQ